MPFESSTWLNMSVHVYIPLIELGADSESPNLHVDGKVHTYAVSPLTRTLSAPKSCLNFVIWEGDNLSALKHISPFLQLKSLPEKSLPHNGTQSLPSHIQSSGQHMFFFPLRSLGSGQILSRVQHVSFTHVCFSEQHTVPPSHFLSGVQHTPATHS